MYAEKYQWIKGDKSGKAEAYTSHDNDWIYFLGGGRIAVNVLNEFMIQVDGDTPLDISITKTERKPNTERPVTATPPKKKEEFNPVKSLLSQAAKDKQECLYKFNIDLPKPAVYNLIKDSFETDVDELLVEMIMSTMDKNELYKNVQEQLKQQILKFYKNGQ